MGLAKALLRRKFIVIKTPTLKHMKDPREIPNSTPQETRKISQPKATSKKIIIKIKHQ